MDRFEPSCRSSAVVRHDLILASHMILRDFLLLILKYFNKELLSFYAVKEYCTFVKYLASIPQSEHDSKLLPLKNAL